MYLLKKLLMPWFDNPYNDPSYPYGYSTKPKYTRRYQQRMSDNSLEWRTETYARPRLPPWYFDKGYAFYQQHMNDWMAQLVRENQINWDNQSKFNRKKLFKRFEKMGDYRIPVYYDFTEFKRKANKYAQRKRQQVLIQQRIERNRQQAIAKRRRLNLIKQGIIRPSK